jgi:hypothetical protein
MSDRLILPQRRFSLTFTVPFWNRPWDVTVGFYDPPERRAGEIFINAAKSPGTQQEALCRDGAILFSLALQYGAPVPVISSALTRNLNGSPSSLIGAIADRPELRSV